MQQHRRRKLVEELTDHLGEEGAHEAGGIIATTGDVEEAPVARLVQEVQRASPDGELNADELVARIGALREGAEYDKRVAAHTEASNGPLAGVDMSNTARNEALAAIEAGTVTLEALQELEGSGEDGRILAEDVRALLVPEDGAQEEDGGG